MTHARQFGWPVFLLAVVLVVPLLSHRVRAQHTEPSTTAKAASVTGEENDATVGNDFVAMSESLPIEFRDPAFDRYVDLKLLAAAWDELNAVLLTDVALQLAEGERVLLRPHKAFSAQQVLEKALQVAQNKKDAATIERLAKVAAQQGNEALKARIAAARKLAAATRGEEAKIMVSADTITPEEFAAIKALIEAVRFSQLAGDAARLEQLKHELKLLGGISERERESFYRYLFDGADTPPKNAAPDVLTQKLQKLSSVSRDIWGDAGKAVSRVDPTRIIWDRPPPSESHFEVEPPDDPVRSVKIINRTGWTIAYKINGTSKPRIEPNHWVSWNFRLSRGARISFDNGKKIWTTINLNGGVFEFKLRGDGTVGLYRG